MKTPLWFENYHSLMESQLRLLKKSVENNTCEFKNFKENHFEHLKIDVVKIKVTLKWIMIIGGFLIPLLIANLLTNIL